MRKLYAATVTVYVVAHNEREAQTEAGHADPPFCAWEIEEATEVPPEWEKAIPWGLGDDEPEWTCSQILAGEAEL